MRSFKDRVPMNWGVQSENSPEDWYGGVNRALSSAHAGENLSEEEYQLRREPEVRNFFGKANATEEELFGLRQGFLQREKTFRRDITTAILTQRAKGEDISIPDIVMQSLTRHPVPPAQAQTLMWSGAQTGAQALSSGDQITPAAETLADALSKSGTQGAKERLREAAQVLINKTPEERKAITGLAISLAAEKQPARGNGAQSSYDEGGETEEGRREGDVSTGSIHLSDLPGLLTEIFGIDWGNPDVRNAAIEGGLEGYSRAGQGIVNAFTGGLFVPSAGLFYDDFNKQWEDLGKESNDFNENFAFGSAGGGFAINTLLLAGGPSGRVALARKGIFNLGAKITARNAAYRAGVRSGARYYSELIARNTFQRGAPVTAKKVKNFLTSIYYKAGKSEAAINWLTGKLTHFKP